MYNQHSHAHPPLMIDYSRREKTKKSCQSLGLYKLKSVQKKKLMTANTMLRVKIKQKSEGTTKLKNAEESAKHWENEHAKIMEEFEGKESSNSHSHTYLVTLNDHHDDCQPLRRIEGKHPSRTVDGRHCEGDW